MAVRNEWKRVRVDWIENGNYPCGSGEEYHLWFTDEEGHYRGYLVPETRCSPDFRSLSSGDILRVLFSYKRFELAAPEVIEVWKGEEPLYPFHDGEFKPLTLKQ